MEVFGIHVCPELVATLLSSVNEDTSDYVVETDRMNRLLYKLKGDGRRIGSKHERIIKTGIETSIIMVIVTKFALIEKKMMTDPDVSNITTVNTMMHTFQGQATDRRIRRLVNAVKYAVMRATRKAIQSLRVRWSNLRKNWHLEEVQTWQTLMVMIVRMTIPQTTLMMKGTLG